MVWAGAGKADNCQPFASMKVNTVIRRYSVAYLRMVETYQHRKRECVL